MPLLDNSGKETEATLKIPFESVKSAEIAFSVLNVDKEPRRNFVQKQLSLESGSTLVVHFIADQPKNLRTAITGFFEALFLCTDTIKAFDPAPKGASVENAGTHASTDTA